MGKFKVGENVRVNYTTDMAMDRRFPGRVGVITDDDGARFRPYFVNFDAGAGWYDACELNPAPVSTSAIPAGWTPADEPPDSTLRVRVLTPIGERNGWFNDLLGAGKWEIFTGNLSTRKAYPGEVLAWREIDPPAAQVRYAITVKGEVDDTDFDEDETYATMELATHAAVTYSREHNKPVEVWKLVAIVNPPAEPEVIRIVEE